MTAATAAQLTGATPRGDGTWYAGAACPWCGVHDSVAITARGWECRYDGCRRAGTDDRRLVVHVLAVSGYTAADIRRTLLEAA